MDKKTILAVLVSVGILIGWQVFFTPKQVENLEKVATPENQTVEVKTVEMPTESGIIQGVTDNGSVVDNPSEEVANKVVETELLTLTFNSNTGDILYASINGWQDHDDNSTVTFNKGVINNDYMRIVTPVRSVPSFTSSRVGNETVITFTSSSKELIVSKEYRLTDDSYMLKGAVKIANKSGATLSVPLIISIGPGIGGGFEPNKYTFEGAMLYSGSGAERVAVDKLKEVTVTNPIWAGYTSKYFLFAVAGGSFEKGKIAPVNAGEVSSVEKNLMINPSSNQVESFNIYIGPKDYKGLKSYNLGLQESIDFGWFYFLAIPMLQMLLLIAGVVKNYGIAIIVLTIIIKIVTLPLTMKGMRSMKAMTKLQPELLKLKEKYKGDPQKMNMATMELYKEHKVNPMSGCIPLLIQIPIFFALYKALLLSIELKGASFLYLTDLSMKDPYYITPIIMGATMFLQQKLTPSTADPMQQKIFLIMPIVFTFLFLSFPSGLVLYWLTNNVLSIIQQLIVNRSKK